MVGINTFILSESGGNEGLGFAIPSDVVTQRLRPDPHAGPRSPRTDRRLPEDHYAGAGGGTALPVSEGVILEDVEPGSSAEKAGLKVGEIVASVGGKQVDDLRQFSLDLYTYKVGQTVDVGVLRKGQVHNIPVMVFRASRRSRALCRHGHRSGQHGQPAGNCRGER